MPPARPHRIGLRASPPSALAGTSRRRSRPAPPTSSTSVIVVNSSVLWNASSRNKGRLAASPNAVSTTGTPSSTELPNAAPKPMIAWRSNGPSNAARAIAKPSPNAITVPP